MNLVEIIYLKKYVIKFDYQPGLLNIHKNYRKTVEKNLLERHVMSIMPRDGTRPSQALHYVLAEVLSGALVAPRVRESE